MAKSKLRILYGEGDNDILEASNHLIRKIAGHTVQPAVGRKSVDEAIRKASFDLVVLGATLSRNDRHHLPYMIKENGQKDQSAGHARRRKPPSLCGCLHRFRREPGVGAPSH